MPQPKPKPVTPKYHSAIDGKFVAPGYAKANPSTTFKESGPHHSPKGKK